MERILALIFESPVWGMGLTLGAYLIGVVI